MSIDRADQYPEVSSDDSGLVPQQAEAEWPKKIRTLSAGELDRLTIDSAGRFYWDGQLVNYHAADAHPPESEAAAPASETAPSADATSTPAGDRDALALLDRAAMELSGLHPVAPRHEDIVAPVAIAVAPAKDAATDATAAIDESNHAMAQYLTQPAEVAVLATQPAPVTAPVVDAPRAALTPTADPRPLQLEAATAALIGARRERVRVALTGGQCFALVLAIFGLLVGAAGLAVQGLVTAHDWGCRSGALHAYCPAPPPAPKPPAVVDIPA